MNANLHILFAIVIWLAFAVVLIRGIRHWQQLEGQSRYGWILLFCAAFVFTLQGEYVELWLDQYFFGLPVTLYIKYFAMVIWFGMYYLIIKKVFVYRRVYQWMDWLFLAAIAAGVASMIPVAQMPYGARTAGRDLVTALRDGFLLIPAALVFVPSTWQLAKQEKVSGARLKQIAIMICYAAYSGLALTNVLKALLKLMHQESIYQVEMFGALFVSICVVGFLLLLVPYRWLTALFYPGRVVLYWKLKRLEQSILRQVGAASDTEHSVLIPVRSSELELAIYRTTINILDYGILLSRTPRQQEQWRKLQSLAESGVSYSSLVDQLIELRLW